MKQNLVEEVPRFLSFRHTKKELVDYESGFAAGLAYDEPLESNSEAWHIGWTEAHE
jgi:hypothetical protein